MPTWKLKKENRNIRFYSPPFQNTSYLKINRIDIFDNIRYYLKTAVEKRCVNNKNKRIVCLLSGGLNSSIIAGLLSDYLYRNDSISKLETYSVGIKDSADLKYADMVAKHLNTKHREIHIETTDIMPIISEIIYATETYDTYTIRNSINKWILAKYLVNNNNDDIDNVIVFTGDGLNEITGGYSYIQDLKNSIDFDHECKDLIKNTFYYDITATEKIFSVCGMDIQMPFMDNEFIQYYLSIPAEFRFYKATFSDNTNNIGKKIIRKSFSPDYYSIMNNIPIIPDYIFWRKHDSIQYDILSFTDRIYDEIDENRFGRHLTPKTSEEYYYRKTFEDYFEGMGKIVPKLKNIYP
jgi:asparagine synthase (glutamine-hydrolysing)